MHACAHGKPGVARGRALSGLCSRNLRSFGNTWRKSCPSGPRRAPHVHDAVEHEVHEGRVPAASTEPPARCEL